MTEYYGHTCKCKCKGKIKIQYHHKFSGIPEYIHGHNRRVEHPSQGKYGKDALGWKGGEVKDANGYIRVWKPEHPFADNRGYVLKSRLVMEEELGRYLKPTEVVHHVNEKVDDNKIENLFCFKSIGDHSRYHRKLRKDKIKGLFFIEGMIL